MSELSPLDKLKKLVFVGELTKEIEIEGIKLTIKTLNTADEIKMLEEAGLSDYPATEVELLKLIPFIVKYSIKSVDGVELNENERDEFAKTFLANRPNKDVLARIYTAYSELLADRLEARDQIKK